MRIPNNIAFKPLSPRSRVAWAIGTVCAVAAICLAVGTAGLYAAGARNEAAARTDLQQADALRRQTLAVKTDEPSESAELGDAGALQSFVEREAARRGCCISEFKAASTTQPYASKFAKKPKGAWTQIEVGFSVQGRLPDVYVALASLSKQEVAFEPSVVDIARDSVSDSGEASVTARVQGRLVQRRKNKK